MSATMLDYNNFSQLPARKPVPGGAAVNRPIVPSSQSPAPQPAHRHTRTSSSNVFPMSPTAPAQVTSISQYPTPQLGHTTMTTNAANQQQSLPMRTHRTLSNATSSTASSRSSADPLHRTGSNRTTSSIPSTSYVALLRKQKATVWCSHAQQLPPNFLAAQKLAKQRANLEVTGSNAPLRPSNSGGGAKQGMTSKIRHGGAKKTGKFTGVQAGGVPMRLSASEVDDGDSEDDWGAGQYGMYHQRSGSGRSSIGANGRPSYASGMSGASGPPGRFSQNSTPPTASSPQSPSGHSIDEETPVPGYNHPSHQAPDYFAQPTGLSAGNSSGSSGSRENSFGDLGKMPENLTPSAAAEKAADDLRRRGSVDERTPTMRGVGRLFVANPDLSD